MANFSEAVMATAEALDMKKGLDIVLLDVSKKPILAETFIVVSGTSPNQVKMLIDEAEKCLYEHGIPSKRKEGYTEGRWVVLDTGDILVHAFHKEERKFYDIERLWKANDNENFMDYSEYAKEMHKEEKNQL